MRLFTCYYVLQSTLIFPLERNIDPPFAYQLGRILNKSFESSQKTIARRLILTASSLGHAPATLNLIDSSLRNSTSSFPSKPDHAILLRQLDLLIEKGNLDAMVIRARISGSQGKQREAMSWYGKAINTPQGLEFDSAAYALTQIGDVFLAGGKKEQAREVYEESALKLDDPYGYFRLAGFLKYDSTESERFTKSTYLTKAAMSGIAEAAHGVGLMELMTFENWHENEKSVTMGRDTEDYGLAREWFEVAAAGGHAPAMINMMLISKNTHNAQEWAAKCEADPEVRRLMTSIRPKGRNSLMIEEGKFHEG